MNKKRFAEITRRNAREVMKQARRELSPDAPEPLAGVALSNEQARSIRELVEARYAHEPIATPYGKLPIRDLVRGLEPPRPIRNPVVYWASRTAEADKVCPFGRNRLAGKPA